MAQPSPSPSFLPGCFGKLPVAADFISRHARDDEALAFERWLQDGVAAAAGRFGARTAKLLEELPEVRFVFWTRSLEEPLIGVFTAGRDRSGRRFPFSVFLQEKQAEGSSAYAEASACAPIVFEPFFREAATIAKTAAKELTDIYAMVEAAGARTPSPEDLRGARPGSLLAEETIDGAPGGTTIATGLRELLKLAREFASRTEPPSFGLRFSLPADEGTRKRSAAACFWLSLVSRGFGNHGRNPVAFWSTGRMDVYLRPPGPLSFLHLVDESLESEGLYQVMEQEDSNGLNAGRASTLGEEPLAGSVRFADLLERTFPESK